MKARTFMISKGKLELGRGKVTKVADAPGPASLQVVSAVIAPVEVVFAPEAPLELKPVQKKTAPAAPRPVPLPAARAHVADTHSYDSVDPALYAAPVVQETKLSGVTFSGYDFASLRTGQQVWLIPDPMGSVVKPDEGHPDPDAVSVQDAPRGGAHIGYIPKAMARIISHYMREEPQVPIEANVVAIKGGTDGFNYGVDIIIRFYEEPA